MSDRTEALKRSLEADYPVRSLDKRAREIAAEETISLMEAYKLAVNEGISEIMNEILFPGDEVPQMTMGENQARREVALRQLGRVKG